MSLSPAEIASTYAGIARAKAEKPALALFALSMMGGMFVALAGVGAQMVYALIDHAGVARLIGALLFPTGLGMILVAGGELFTGNCMMVLGPQQKACTHRGVLRSWALVYLGNGAGAVLIGLLCVLARRSDAAFISVVISSAQAKVALPVSEAFLRGVLCNIFVCAAVWMSYSTRSSTGKIVCMYLPVALFVLCGMEHCVANMFYFSAAYFAGGSQALHLGDALLHNMLPVTLGNIVGGSVLFSGGMYLAFFHTNKKTA